MATIIKGKEVAEYVLADVRTGVDALLARGITPCLAVILVGDDPASEVYVRKKKEKCEELGIRSLQIHLPAETTQQELLARVEALNADPSVHGVLCQLPLPEQIDEQTIVRAVRPEKDVDGFTCRISADERDLMPCTPAGVMEMLRYAGVAVAGKRCVVVGRSNIVGKPMAALLLQADGTVTVCHSKTRDLAAVTREADILVAAVGKPHFITADMVKEGAVVIDVGVSGPGVVNKALQRAIEESGRKLTLSEIAEVIKHTAYKVTRVGELIGRGVAKAMDIPFGVADLSLAPTPAVGDSVGEIFQTLGLSSIGAPGSTAILAMLNDAVKKGGVFASSHVGGLSGAFIPVSEDSAIEAAARSGALTMEKLEAMTCVCSVGLDMIAIPGDTPAETISAMIADEAAIGMVNSKTTAVRIIPVPGKTVGDVAVFGGLLGEASIIRVPGGDSQKFIDFGGRIPAPIHSLRN